MDLWLVDVDLHGTPLDRWSVRLQAGVHSLEVELTGYGCFHGGIIGLFEAVGLARSLWVNHRG